MDIMTAGMAQTKLTVQVRERDLFFYLCKYSIF